ncbi:MAG: hypothetical protein DMF93_17110 [Acidobacteria bacterium]|nr:MAG: hypothetical protein DMF93_17110 [Acidobacteriota bacterium]
MNCSPAKREDATPFDATRFAEVTLNHGGDRCTFEAILEDFHLSDPAWQRVGHIVRAADVTGQESIAFFGNFHWTTRCMRTRSNMRNDGGFAGESRCVSAQGVVISGGSGSPVSAASFTTLMQRPRVRVAVR